MITKPPSRAMTVFSILVWALSVLYLIYQFAKFMGAE